MSEQFKKIANGGSVLFVGEIVVQVCGFLRNIIIARLIAPDQFGIAAALAMTVAMVEMLSDLGVGRYLTRIRGGGEESWLSTANAISIIRGTLGSSVLFCLAPLIASSLNMEEHVWSFRLVALLPFFRGFTHNEIWFAQRYLRYKAFVICQALPQVITLFVSIPLALWLKDFRAMMYILMLNSILNVVLSHLVLEQKYCIGIDKTKFKKLLKFGIPLLLDGLLVFLVLHGDRLIFARHYGPDLLGIYSAAFLLAWTPTAVIGRIATSLGLPYFSRFQDDVIERESKYSQAVMLSLIPAVFLAFFFGVAGGELIEIAFGVDYYTSSLFIAWLGFGRALSILRTVPIVLALAEGRSVVTMLTNLTRSLAVVFGILSAGSVTPVVIMMIAVTGELAALITAICLNRKIFYISPKYLFKPTVITAFVFLCGLVIHEQLLNIGTSKYIILLSGLILSLVLVIIFVVQNKITRSIVSTYYSRVIQFRASFWMLLTNSD